MESQKKFIMAAEQLIAVGYCYLPFPLVQSIPIEIYKGLDHLLGEEMNFKKTCVFNTHGLKEPTEGLIVRKGSQSHPDFKAYWHHTPSFERQISNKMNVRYGKWLREVQALYKMSHNHSIAFAVALDTVTHNEYMFADSLIDAQRSWKSILRVVKYYPQALDRDLAKSHFDKSLFSIALHSTQHNLFLQHGNEEFIATPPEGHVLIFCGNTMASMTGGQYINHKTFVNATMGAMSYRVKNKERKVQNSLLFFAHTTSELPYE